MEPSKLTKVGNSYINLDSVTLAVVTDDGNVTLNYVNGSNQTFSGDNAVLLRDLLCKDCCDPAGDAAKQAAAETEAESEDTTLSSWK